MTASRFDNPNDATVFEVKGGPVTSIVKGGTAGDKDGADRAVHLILREGGTKSVVAGVTEITGVVGGGVPVGENQDWWTGEVAEKLSSNGFHSRGEDK